MSYGPIFYISKSGDAFADTLAAYGLAKVLDGILLNSDAPISRKIMIRDAGPYYAVELQEPLQEEWVERCSFFSLARPIKTPKYACEGLPEPWDYNGEWERFREVRETAQALRQASSGDRVADSEMQTALADLRMQPEFETLLLLGDFRMAALPVYNEMALLWCRNCSNFCLNVKTILEMCASPDTDQELVAEQWWKAVEREGSKREVTASQLFNPTRGKGQNRTKANALIMGNERSFWLLEYLKAVGLWVCAAPRRVSGGDDRKTYVVSPLSLSLGAHQTVFKRFAVGFWGDTSVKMDCKAALAYTDTLLEYSESGQQDELDFEGYGPENVIAGFHVATYKLMKNYVVMNLAFIGLPQWTGTVRTRARAQELKEVIKEHLRVLQSIRTLDEKKHDLEKSEVYSLLSAYRDFVSSSQWDRFFDFAAGYGQYLLSEWNRKNLRPAQFTTQNLRRLFMCNGPRFSEIIENEGFQAIATAIRQSTVIPQYQKALFQQGKGDKPLYEIRYGLGQELKRKAAYKQEFLTALSDFLQAYNQENVQKAESSERPQRRKNVRTSDISDIVRLVDQFGSEIVCNLLVAFGYARDVKEMPDKEDIGQEEQ